MSDPGFTLVQLRYFVTAARLGSMTAASRHLMVSQSAVSTAVAQLEKEPGVQLLLRHHAKGLTLTAAGHGVLAEATRLLEQSADLAKKADESAHQLAGTLSVGCFSTLAPFELPLLLDRYHRKHPGVVLDVLEGEHAGLKARLRSAEREVARRRHRQRDHWPRLAARHRGPGAPTRQAREHPLSRTRRRTDGPL